jgi:uncharacterized membrane protein YphA (DoxX/SURF4 family)
MNTILRIIRLAVGILFVFSGLVKLNDPAGTAIKLEEYFEVFATSFGTDLAPFFEFFVPYSLPMSLVFCVAEVVLGIAFLLRYEMWISSWIAFAMVVFFTFLTGYSAIFEKVTDCGCFGDFIKLNPWTTFYKDIVLTVVVGLLVIYRRLLPNLLGAPTRHYYIGVATAICFAAGFYVDAHLPFADWRPYNIGASIPLNMKASGPLRYEYTMVRNGEMQKFEQYPEDTTWHYQDMKLLNPEAMPKITDYRVWNDEADFTDSSFIGAKLIVIVQNNAGTYTDSKLAPIVSLVKGLESFKADSSSIAVTPWVITSMESGKYDIFRHRLQLSAPFYYADATVLKTIMRPQVGTWLLINGSVRGKWHINDTPTAAQVIELANKRVTI